VTAWLAENLPDVPKQPGERGSRMTRRTALAHEFVEYMPDQLKDGVLYVSIPFATGAHKCCCGCGQEVVTPLSPTDWKLIFDGRSISLDPSNLSLPCLAFQPAPVPSDGDPLRVFAPPK